MRALSTTARFVAARCFVAAALLLALPLGAQTPPPTVPSSNEERENSENELLLEQLDAELNQEVLLSSTSQPRLNLYGFADLTFYKYFLHKDSGFRNTLYTNSAFAVGNLNLYLASNLGSGWSSLAEVRFSYLPLGSRSIEGGTLARTQTEAQDYTSLGLQRRTGSVVIERAWVEYRPLDWLSVRAGQWLTPYGIWNVDHGSPTIIPVSRPFVISYALLPEHQTGLRLEGTSSLTDDLSLTYVLGLANGRGPIDEVADLDANKGITARVSATLHTLGRLEVGATAYYGRYTDLNQTLVVNGAGARVEDAIAQQYDELAMAADVRFELDRIHFQAELISSQQAYTDAGRPARNEVEYWPDLTRFGAYAVGGYRFDWFALMPFLMAEYFQLSNTFEPARPPADDAVIHFSAGFNSRPTPNVTLKTQVEVGFSSSPLPPGSSLEHPVWAVQTQTAWAF